MVVLEVLVQRQHLVEGQAAVVTLVRLLAGVDADVLLKRGELSEGLAAFFNWTRDCYCWRLFKSLPFIFHLDPLLLLAALEDPLLLNCLVEFLGR